MKKRIRRKSRKVSTKLFGAARVAKRAPLVCRRELSSCMKGGGRRKAGPCMRSFQRCIKK
jgi:hypothetical protein